MTTFDQLSDQAFVKLYPIAPALSAEHAQHLIDAMQKLLRQFEREGASASADCAVLEDGAVLAIAHESGNEGDLSGCRKDKIAKVIKHCEEQHQVRILDAPPMMVHIDGTWQACDRAALKSFAADGKLSQDHMAYDLRLQRLGDWRQSAQMPIKSMWMSPIVAKILS